MLYYKKIWDLTRKNRYLRFFLVPLSLIYLLILTIRKNLFRLGIFTVYNPPIQTICIGNSTIGGSGKTPIVLYLANHLKSEYSLGLLSRGYNSKATSYPHLIKSEDDVLTTGDEALFISNSLSFEIPFVISPNRKDGIEKLISLNSNLIIMDDGLQHLAVNPQIKISLINLENTDDYLNAQNYSVIPYGIFRESPYSHFKGVDRVAFIAKQKINPELKEKINIISKKFEINSYSILSILAEKIIDAYSLITIAKENLCEVHLLSSIAYPESFELSARSLNLEVKEHTIKNDHFIYTNDDWKNIKAKANKPILCTSKDWIKLKNYIQKENELYVLTQSVDDISDDGENLLEWIKSKLK
jgi:tetraacyldisaccharide 4'-kinase